MLGEARDAPTNVVLLMNAILFSCYAALILGGPALGAAQPDGSIKTSVVIDATVPEACSAWGPVNIHQYTPGTSASTTEERRVFFGNPLAFDIEGFGDDEGCRVTATFLSDGKRTLALEFNGADFDSQTDRDAFRVSLDLGDAVTRSWDLPAERIRGGKLSVVIRAEEGPNAVLQRLEVATPGGMPLRVNVRKPFDQVTDAELERMVLPLPQLTMRPARVEGVAAAVMPLDGIWQFSPEDNGEFRPIHVPGEWTMQGFKVTQGEFALYRRKVAIPADWRGQRLKLRFDAVHAVCRVMWNGTEVGRHAGGFVPFELDVTDAARPGEENVLEVRVQCESLADKMACMSQYAVHQVGGILRKVTLFAVPPVHVVSEYHTTALDSSCRDAVWRHDAQIVNTTAQAQTVHLTVALHDKNDRKAGSFTNELTIPAGETVNATGTIDVADADLWTSETPSLYTAVTSLQCDGETVASHTLKTGLRQIEQKGNQLFVNGRPVKLMGINRHEVHPLTGRSLDPRLCRRDAELYKNANVNLVRTSHYPPSEEFLEACDELGLFVESEAAFCWVGTYSVAWRTLNHLNPDYFPMYLQGNLDHIAAWRNHPCILFWSMANESAWTPLWRKVMEVLKGHDASRPIAFHDNYTPGRHDPGNQPDIANFHYPSEQNPDSWSSEQRPVWFGEYAHLQCYNRHELVTDPGIQEDWSRPLQRMVDLMWEQPGCLGGAIWSGIDDVFHLPDGNLCGYGHWGPIDGWRREKPEHHGMRMAYSPIRFLSVKTGSNGALEIDVQNRHNFLNLKDCTIEWTGGGRSGALEMDLEPHAKGRFAVPGPFRKGDEVKIVLNDPGGREIAREIIPVGGTIGHNNVKAGRTTKPAWNPDSKTLECPGGPAMALPVPMVLALNSAGGANGPSGRTLSNVIAPDTPVGEWTWVADTSSTETLRFRGSGAAGKGWLELAPSDNGGLLVRYGITVSSAKNPRQWGLVLTLPRAFDTLQWSRNAHWSWYPEDHIGRAQGMARANPTVRKLVEEPGLEPRHAWKDDSNALGSNDFRSTKTGIAKASLSAPGQPRVVVLPVPGGKDTQSVRAWVDGDCIRLLVAGFNTGGADHFFATHYGSERRPLAEGETVSSQFLLYFEEKE